MKLFWELKWKNDAHPKLTKIQMFVNTILIMSNVARLQLIYGVTDVILNCQSKLILKVIQGHQGEKSQWRVTKHKSIVWKRFQIRTLVQFWKTPSERFPRKLYTGEISTVNWIPTRRYAYAKLLMIRYAVWGVFLNCTGVHPFPTPSWIKNDTSSVSMVTYGPHWRF